jgi:hypothetical protein
VIGRTFDFDKHVTSHAKSDCDLRATDAYDNRSPHELSTDLGKTDAASNTECIEPFQPTMPASEVGDYA